MSAEADAFGEAMAEAAEQVAAITGWTRGDAALGLMVLCEEFARAAGYADAREAVRTRPIEQTQADVRAFAGALIQKSLPPAPKKRWRKR
jgi:hypothetical protein